MTDKITGPFSYGAILPGDRVEIGPHLDAWMQGDRLGEVSSVNRKYVRVKMDVSRRSLKVAYDDLYAVLNR